MPPTIPHLGAYRREACNATQADAAQADAVPDGQTGPLVDISCVSEPRFVQSAYNFPRCVIAKERVSVSRV
jgi:hypothetical protein